MTDPSPTAPVIPQTSHARVEVSPSVNFFSIETEAPARAFWARLARLLFSLGAAARRKGESRR